MRQSPDQCRLAWKATADTASIRPSAASASWSSVASTASSGNHRSTKAAAARGLTRASGKEPSVRPWQVPHQLHPLVEPIVTQRRLPNRLRSPLAEWLAEARGELTGRQLAAPMDRTELWHYLFWMADRPRAKRFADALLILDDGRQHVVPRLLLRRFAARQGLHVLPAGRPNTSRIPIERAGLAARWASYPAAPSLPDRDATPAIQVQGHPRCRVLVA